MGGRSRDEDDAHAETAIAQASGTDATAMAEVSGTDRTMAAPSGTQPPSTSPPSDPLGDAPRELGDAPPPSQRYVDEGELARGGLGRISRARDRHLGRGVVLKEMLRRGRDEGRFVREAILTAALQHPAIVPVYDAGRWESGEPFFAMRPVEGRHLGDALFAAKTLDARLALLPNLLRAAEAVAYAHAHGVIHRDLKPSNILVGAYGDTVVIDWGLAKRIGMRDAADADSGAGAPLASDDTAHTVAGTVMGTPAYMPPEQAESSDTVDARADVYALGAILYQLLVGQPPFTGTSSEQILDRVRSEAPRPVLEVVPSAPRDLIAIVEKAMSRDAATRYANAGELVTELERFTTGRLVAAHEYTRRELIARFLRKHRAAVSVGAIALATLAVAGTIAITQIVRARDDAQAEGRRAIAARDQAEKNRKAADERSAALLVEQARDQAVTDPFGALATLAKLPDDLPDWSAPMLVAANAVADGLPRSLDVGPVAHFEVSGDGKLLAAVLADGRVMAWTEDMTAMRALDGRSAPPTIMVLSRDGSALFTGDADGRLVVWNTKTGAMRTLRERGHVVRGAWPRADGSVVVYDRGPVVFPADGGAEQRTLNMRSGIKVAAVEFDDRHLVEVDPDKAYVIDLETASVLRVIDEKDTDPRSSWFSTSWDGKVSLVGGMLEGAGARRRIEGDIVSPDGKMVISMRDGGLAAVEVATGRVHPVLSGAQARMVGFLDQGRSIAARDVSTVHVIDLENYDDHKLELGGEMVRTGAQWVAIRAGARGLRIIKKDRATVGFEVYWDRGWVIAASPSGHWYAIPEGDDRERIEVYSAAGKALTVPRSDVRAMAFAPDDEWLAIAALDGTTRLRELATGKERTIELPAGISRLWVGARGAWIIAATRNRSFVWSATDGAVHDLGEGDILGAKAAGARVVTTTSNGNVSVWDASWHAVRTFTTVVTTRELRKQAIVDLATQTAFESQAAVPNADGTRIAVRAPTLRVIDVDSGRSVWESHGAHDDCAPAMIAGGRLLARCGSAATVFDLERETVVRTLESDESPEMAVLSPDGRRAFTIHNTHARVWDTTSGAWRSVPWDFESGWYSATFEGRAVRAVGGDGVAVIPDDVPPDPAAFRAWLAGFR